MKKLLSLIAALSVVLIATAALAEQKPVYELFPGYAYGMPKSDVAQKEDVAPGEKDLDRYLFLQQASFAGQNWQVRFEFTSEALTRVGLMGPYSQERFDAVKAHLREQGYEALALLADNRSLDFLTYLKTEGPDALNAKVAEMLQTKPERLTYAWFDTREMPSGIKRMSRNITELLAAVAEGTREVEVTLLTVKDKGALLLVDFSFPILDAVQRKAPRPQGSAPQ